MSIININLYIIVSIIYKKFLSKEFIVKYYIYCKIKLYNLVYHTKSYEYYKFRFLIAIKISSENC
jgi:hypothetical protein